MFKVRCLLLCVNGSNSVKETQNGIVEGESQQVDLVERFDRQVAPEHRPVAD